MSKHEVIRQDWEESERGWGVSPDGYSLHMTPEDSRAFVKEYWGCMPRNVPDTYARPSGNPYRVTVDEDTYRAVKTSKFGVRF